MEFFNAAPAASLPLKAPPTGTPAASLPLKAPAITAAARPAVRALLFVLSVCFVHEAAADSYRYTDDRGRVVYGQTVPPQFVKNGYEVLNNSGQVIKVVPRALTADELAAQEAVREQQMAEEAVLRAQQEADSLLLRLYRSPDDIARKRDERTVLLDGQRTAVAAALEKVEAEVLAIQQSIDRLSAAGTEIPAETQETLRIRQEERDRLISQRDRLDSDKATAIADAERDMKRLAELMGLPD